MNKLIIALSSVVILSGTHQIMAQELEVNVTNIKLRDGCDYKKVQGYKRLQIVCVAPSIIESNDSFDSIAPAPVSGFTENEVIAGPLSGETVSNSSNGSLHPNNGWGNGSDNTIGVTSEPPGKSGKTGNFAAGSTDLR